MSSDWHELFAYKEEALRKLEQGKNRLEQAGNEPVMLGSALISLHGALEDYIRFFAVTQPEIALDQQKEILDRRQTQWQQLLDFAETYSLIDTQGRQIILHTNKLRQEGARTACHASNVPAVSPVWPVKRASRVLHCMVACRKPFKTLP